MESAAAKIVLQGMLDGVFSVFDALLGCTFKTVPEAPEALAEGQIEGLLADNPVVLRARIQNGLGAVAFLLPTEGAATFAAAISEGEPAGDGTLSDEEKATLTEVLEPALGGGVTNLMERFGRNVEQLEDSALLPNGRDNAQEVAVYLGFGAVFARFSYDGGEGPSGTGVVLAGQELVDLAPAEEPGGAAEGAALSEAEMGDILGDFGGTPQEGAAPALASSVGVPGNMEMVLDIRLVATARLGRVEMPIGDILSLGPGSIIEIDQLVDEAIELLINGKLVARGDVVVVDEKFGLRITEIVSQRERIESLR